MKKFLCLWLLTLVACLGQAQILTPVKWKIKLDDSESVEKTLTFTATIDNGWHLYDMNLPEGGPVSTSFAFETVKGAKLIGEPIASKEATTVFDEQFNMNLRWFAKNVSFTQKIEVTDPKGLKLEGYVEFMACNDENCLPPEKEEFSFDKKNIDVEKTLAALAAKGETQPEEPLVADTSDETAEQAPVAEENKPVAPTKTANKTTTVGNTDLWKPVIDELKAFGDATITAADTSWLFIFFAGFLGGLVALLTPCVWPMIPMTVSFFLKRTKDRKKAIRDAMTYGVSIIVIYLVMGLLITGLFGASALNDLSTNAIFNIIFFLLLVLFAVSFFGAFELVLPASWTNKLDSKADSTTGIISIFFMSFTLVLVSFSCTGPIIGTLLVQAASMGTAIGPAIGMFGFALA